jgi:hypothetical protein
MGIGPTIRSARVGGGLGTAVCPRGQARLKRHAGVDGESELCPPLRFTIRPAALRVRISARHPGASPSARLAFPGPPPLTRRCVQPVRAVHADPAGLPAPAGRAIHRDPGGPQGRRHRRQGRADHGGGLTMLPALLGFLGATVLSRRAGLGRGAGVRQRSAGEGAEAGDGAGGQDDGGGEPGCRAACRPGTR